MRRSNNSYYKDKRTRKTSMLIYAFWFAIISSNNNIVEGFCQPSTAIVYHDSLHFKTVRSTFVRNNNVAIRRTPPLNMALIPLPSEEIEILLATGNPTGLQYATYWGRTKKERYNSMFEFSTVSILGMIFSYLMSFVLGTFVATILGCLFAFWAVLAPDFKARQRNWEFLGGRDIVDPWKIDASRRDEDKQGLYGSLYLGRIADVCVVEDQASKEEYNLDDFQDYTMDTDDLEQWTGLPYLLRVRIDDDEGRELQVHARMSEEYLDIEPDMPVLAILLSVSQKFTSLAAMSDILVPNADCWIGDYPYLNRPEIEDLLDKDKELWNRLQSQSREEQIDFDFEDIYNTTDTNDIAYTPDDDENDNENIYGFSNDTNRPAVPVRRRGRR